MKVLTIVGARPQFIKAGVVSPVLREHVDEILVHTGQHYDSLLSDIFFEQLAIPTPDYQLAVGSDHHGAQTGRMFMALEPVLLEERPDVVMVYGDTNSTLAGALTAAKLGIAVVHVEAGLRSYNRAMPEEINRIVVDHVASRLYCPTATAVGNLAQEGITEGVVLTGDVMDELVLQVNSLPHLLDTMNLTAGQYTLVTVHRQENTEDRVRLSGIVNALREISGPIIWPLHPRTRQKLYDFELWALVPEAVRRVEPMGYIEMITLERHARQVLTDSGGVQREAAALGVPVYVLRQETEWAELIESGRAVLVGTDSRRIVEAVKQHKSHPIPLVMETEPSQILVKDLIQRYS
jgi:UDP-N-acetylglucosamine 2-epimerase